MENYQYQDPNVIVMEEGQVAKKFFAKVFTFMFIALSLSSIAAYLFSNSPALIQHLVNINPSTGRQSISILGWVAMLAPLGLVLTINFGLSRLSYGVLATLFVAYSVLTGVSLSFILLTYTSSSVFACFVGAAAIFGVMAVMGYTTSVDLTKLGPILMAGVIGLIICSVANMFIQSEQFSIFYSFIGVAIFTALTAYDVQKIKRIGQGIEANGEDTLRVESKKMAIVAALSLYLDFLNIFIYLLRIFGDRK